VQDVFGSPIQGISCILIYYYGFINFCFFVSILFFLFYIFFYFAYLYSLLQLIKAIHVNDRAQIDEMLPRIDVVLPAKDKDKTGKDLMRAIMRRFLPLADSLLDCVFTHLPSPVEAQKYRTDLLYDGDLNDEYAKAIRECDPKGPLLVFISKMFPVPNTKAFYAFGRVFSGTLSYGQKVYAIGGSKKEESSKNVQRLVPMSIRSTDNLEYCPCGNIVALQGIDSLLVKCGTISSSPSASPIKNMKFSVSPVVRAAVSCKNPQDLPKLLEGLKYVFKIIFIYKISYIYSISFSSISNSKLFM
jgi:elongation factor 2